MILDWYNKVRYKAAAASQFVIMYGGKASLILAPRSIALCFCTFYLYFKNILQPDFFKYIKNCKSCVMCVKTVPWGFHAELRLTQVVINSLKMKINSVYVVSRHPSILTVQTWYWCRCTSWFSQLDAVMWSTFASNPGATVTSTNQFVITESCGANADRKKENK